MLFVSLTTKSDGVWLEAAQSRALSELCAYACVRRSPPNLHC